MFSLYLYNYSKDGNDEKRSQGTKKSTNNKSNRVQSKDAGVLQVFEEEKHKGISPSNKKRAHLSPFSYGNEQMSRQRSKSTSTTSNSNYL